MRMSQVLIPTLREDPGEAEIISHRLMLRAGFIRRVAAGIYTYLPLGLRVIRKIENIVREAMNKAGAQEVLMPILSPAELWQETGRWDFYGKELLRCQDRHDRAFCFGPTHEEVITDLFRRDVRSYRHLPLNCYQIQTKFRDEIRPRFGLMRGREFLMKDASSFDRDEPSAQISYQKMYEADQRIFEGCGLRFRAVQADTGLIGGNVSHEFMVLAETGEETILYEETGSYAANVEQAETFPQESVNSEPSRPLQQVNTPGTTTIEQVSAYLQRPSDTLVKTLLYQMDNHDIVAILIRGDHEANDIKIKRVLQATDLHLANPEIVTSLTSAPVGFAGPVNLSNVRILADYAIKPMKNFVVGGNQADTHLVDVNWDRDFHIEQFADLRKAQAGDPSPHNGSPLQTAKGIEVGHVFLLGTKYSKAMGAKFLDDQGKDQFAVMGCYGIGISRTAAACMEQNHDDKGMIWPLPIAPFHVHLLPLSKSDQVKELTQSLYASLIDQNIEVLWDDRNERAGVKFNDADLIGAPFQVTIGEKGLAKGTIEVKHRKTGEIHTLKPEEMEPYLRDQIFS